MSTDMMPRRPRVRSSCVIDTRPALSGKRSPYPGKLGVVEEGALADLLLVDGDPLQNLELLTNPAKAFVVIMKDGKVYKNALE